MQFGFTVIKTENFAVLVLMVAYSLAKAKEGVRISYTALFSNKLNNMEKCMRCGHEIIIGGNFMLSEINGEELNEEDDAMVTNAHCPYCGARYELTDTPESEKKNYPYWNE